MVRSHPGSRLAGLILLAGGFGLWAAYCFALLDGTLDNHRLSARAAIFQKLDQSEPAAAPQLSAGLYPDLSRQRISRMARLTLPQAPAETPDDVFNAAERKLAFINRMLPLIEAENDRIMAARDRLVAVAEADARNRPVAGTDRAFVRELADTYKTDASDMEELLARVDVVPPSLVLAQGAEESGWGTSRGARVGNSFFGQMTWDHSEAVPHPERTRTTGPVLKAFDDSADAVKSYLLNLNTNSAYQSFRDKRAAKRREGRPFDGAVLAGHLTRYSERGEDYIAQIRTIIRTNRLHELDRQVTRAGTAARGDGS